MLQYVSRGWASPGATLAASLLACAVAEAQSSAEIEHRINAAFELVLESSVVAGERPPPAPTLPKEPGLGSFESRPISDEIGMARLPRPRPDDGILGAVFAYQKPESL